MTLVLSRVIESASRLTFKLIIQVSVFVFIVALLKHKAMRTDGT